jgi:hypothetical protein
MLGPDIGFEGSMSVKRWGAVTLLLALLARIAAASLAEPVVGADGFAYLNYARQLRGAAMPDGWDESAFLPFRDQGTRMPGYPIFLNSVFAVVGTSSPQYVLERLRKFGVSAWHLRFLSTEEDLRAVQFTQHGLGLIGTSLTFWLVWVWTQRAWLASGFALVACGIRPSWLFLFEPALLSETLSAVFLLGTVACLTAIAERYPKPRLWMFVLGVLGGAVGLIHPGLVFVPMVVVFAVIWTRPSDWRRVAILLIPCVLLPLGWVVRNGVHYDSWRLSTIAGIGASCHWRCMPEVFRSPAVRAAAEAHRCSLNFGVSIATDLWREGWSLRDVAIHLERDSLRAIVVHPSVWIRSVAAAFVRELWPNETLLAPTATTSTGGLWSAGIVCALALNMIGLVAVGPGNPLGSRLAAFIAVGSITLYSLATNNGDNTRYAFPVEAIRVACAAPVLLRIGRALRSLGS